MELDVIDSRILYELDRNARIPETRLGKLVRRSKESIRYRIKKLEEMGVIQGYSLWVDPVKLGFMSAKIYLSLANKPELKKEFINHVKKDRRLYWLGVAEGAWNAGLTYFIRTNREFYELKNTLFSKFKDLILSANTAVLVSVHTSDKNYLYEAQTEWKELFAQKEYYEIDEADKKILSALFENSRMSLAQVARNTQLTVDIVRQRKKKLEEKGIIKRYVAAINHTVLGLEFFKSFLFFKNLTTQDEQRLMEYARQQPNTIHLIKQISPWDVELEIMCKNYREYNEIINGYTSTFADIIEKVETAIMGEDYILPSSEIILL